MISSVKKIVLVGLLIFVFSTVYGQDYIGSFSITIDDYSVNNNCYTVYTAQVITSSGSISLPASNQSFTGVPIGLRVAMAAEFDLSSCGAFTFDNLTEVEYGFPSNNSCYSNSSLTFDPSELAESQWGSGFGLVSFDGLEVNGDGFKLTASWEPNPSSPSASISVTNNEYGTTTTNICENASVTLTASPSNYGNVYEWKYSTNGTNWTTIATGRPSAYTFTPSSLPLRTPMYFGYELGNCSGIVAETSNPSTIFPVPPEINTASSIGSPPLCSGDDGSITFTTSQLTRQPDDGETFTFMVYDGLPDFDADDFSNPPSITVPDCIDCNKRLEGSSITMNIPPGDDYHLFIFPETASDGSTISSGCGEPSFHKITIPSKDPIEVTFNNVQSPSCHNGNAGFSLNVSNGTAGFTYLLNGTTTITPDNPNSSTPSFDLSVTTYTALLNDFYVKVTDDNGCEGQTSTIPGFTNPDLLSISSVSTGDILCNGGTTDLTVVLDEPVPNNGTITYSIDGYAAAQSSETFSVPAGTYTVRVTNTVGSETCVDTYDISISEPTKVLVEELTSLPPTCEGGSDGSFTVSASEGSGSDYTFSVDGAPFSSEIEYFGTPGDYSVVARDEFDCESDAIQVVIPEDPTPLNFTVSIDDQTCSYTEDGIIEVININNELSADITYSYYSTLDDFRYPNENDPIMDNLKADSYTVYVSDGTCEASLLGQIVGTPLPLSASELMDSVICYGESNGRLEVLVEGGTAPYQYLWEHDGSTLESIEAASGIYTVDIVDDQDCILSDQSFEILEPFELTADYEKTDITCHDDNDGTLTLLDVQGGNDQEPYTYEWSDDPSINASERSNLPSGSYEVIISDRKGCSYTIEGITIINPAPVELSLKEQTNVNCYGENTGLLIVEMIGGVGNYEYSIDGWATTQSEPDFSGLSAGSYTIFAMDANLCETSIATVITEPSAPLSVSLTEEDATCTVPGKVTATVTGGTPPYSYEWEGLEDTDNIIEVLAGNYPLTVTDENGCVVTTAGNLTSLDGAQVTIEDQQQPSCSYSADGTASISIVGISPFTVIWDHGELGTTVDELSIGENGYSVIDANGCLVREVVTFDAPQPLLLTVEEMERPSCNGATDGSFTVAISGGNGDYELIWDHGDEGTALTNLTAGDYPVEITDGKSCVLDTLVTLPEKELLELTIISTDPSCFESMDGTVEAVVTGGNGDYQYSWSNGAETASQSELDEGTYTVTVTDALGCEISEAVTLTDPPLTEVTIDDIAICSGQSYQVIARVEALSYSWTGPNDFTATGREAVVSEPGSYELTIIDLIGCEVKESFEVFIDDDALDADFLVAGTAYVGDTLLLIDITWPVPDDVSWELPEAARVISWTVDYAEIVFDEPGDYNLAMYCEWGGCDASYQQVISILSRTEETARAFEFAAPEEPMISEVGLYPNPTDDRTNLTITLKEKGDAIVSIIDLSGNEIKYYETLTGLSAYGLRIDTNHLLPGLYFLQVEVSHETRTLRLIVK